ncbi:virion morph [Eastern grey kangaroopox virus]|uniref:Virion morph n=1 Tax=Eastern grey kangaroopox virus TaxID=2042482 RepID=A0A2C9DT41_9POXV|nr:virion morph [Eastern grey kangaroopox virus]ATI21174.1 virion morph [Eastern grey kangaroopox virus]ATX75079.1 virion morph [Eastern grey kangaroopox virus]
MDHRQYVLTMFFAEDESFVDYLADRDDDQAMEDVLLVKRYLNFLLALLIRSKDKLEALGHCYEQLSRSFRALIRLRSSEVLVKTFHRPLVVPSGQPVTIDRGYLSDFVVSLIRLEKDRDYDIPEPTRFLNPSDDVYLKNVVSILKRE